MAGHFIDCFAPGVGPEASDRLTEALSRVGRTVGARQRQVAGALPPPQPGTLRWSVHKLHDTGGTFLVVREVGIERWDLSFFRALSAAVDGLVGALEQYDSLTREGLATFLAGRTLEVATRDLTGPLTVGAQPLPKLLGGASVEEVHAQRFAELCNTIPFRLRQAETVVVEDWKVSPPKESFTPESLPAECRAFVADMDAKAWQGALASGAAKDWQWRAARSPAGLSFIELRRGGTLDAAGLTELSGRLSRQVLAVELASGGKPFRWAEADGGKLTGQGSGQGTQDLIKALFSSMVMVGEGPGLLFGRGTQGWTAAKK
jgi:hypothetical protein